MSNRKYTASLACGLRFVHKDTKYKEKTAHSQRTTANRLRTYTTEKPSYAICIVRVAR